MGRKSLIAPIQTLKNYTIEKKHQCEGAALLNPKKNEKKKIEFFLRGPNPLLASSCFTDQTIRISCLRTYWEALRL